MKTLIKFHADERVDLPDAEKFAGELTLEENGRFGTEFVLPTGRTVGAAATSARVLAGFDIETIVGGTCSLTRGSGFFPIRRDGEVTYGHLAGDAGAVSQEIDLSLQPDDDYAIFVRITHTDTDKENRVHWDDNATSEAVLFVDTREELTWEWTYRSSSAGSPSGGDWVKVWELTVAAGSITVATDYRHFFFEGDAKSGASQWAHEWGSGTDRNSDRATYGVQDLHDFVSAFRQKIDDIQGAYYDWWETPGIDLSALENEHYGAAQSGKHKQVTFGSATGWTKLFTESAAGYWQRAIVEFSETSKAGMYFYSWNNGANTKMALRFYPYDHTAVSPQDMQIGDEIFTAYGTQWLDYVERIASNKVRRRWTKLGADEILFRMDSGYASDERGIELVAGAGYHLASRQVFQIIDLCMFPDTGTSWELTTGIASADVASNQLYLGTGIVGDQAFAIVHDFPPGATLNAVHVYWHQAAAAASRDLRMYVARCQHSAGLNSGSGRAAGESQSRLSLSSVADYIEYTYSAATPYEITSFDCDQNHTALDRKRDEIHIGLYAGDSASPGAAPYKVFAIGLLFTYTEASPFPVA